MDIDRRILGRWSNGCVDCTSENCKTYAVSKYTFNENRSFELEDQHYEDKSCQKLLMKLRSTGYCEIFNSDTVEKISLKFIMISQSFYTEELVKQANKEKKLGIQKWKISTREKEEENYALVNKVLEPLPIEVGTNGLRLLNDNFFQTKK